MSIKDFNEKSRVASLFRIKITENVKFCKGIKECESVISADLPSKASKRSFGIVIALKHKRRTFHLSPVRNIKR